MNKIDLPPPATPSPHRGNAFVVMETEHRQCYENDDHENEDNSDDDNEESDDDEDEDIGDDDGATSATLTTPPTTNALAITKNAKDAEERRERLRLQRAKRNDSME